MNRKTQLNIQILEFGFGNLLLIKYSDIMYEYLRVVCLTLDRHIKISPNEKYI